MTNQVIAGYVRAVGQCLHTQGPARRHALEQLSATLTQTATQLGSPTKAVKQCGPAADYARQLDAQLAGTHTTSAKKIPFNKLLTNRLTRTFAPDDKRLWVSKGLFRGKELNLGAIAVKLGLLGPQDADADVLEAATDELLPGQIAAAAESGAGIAFALALWGRRAALADRSGRHVTSTLVSATAAFGLGLAMVAGSNNQELAPVERLVLPAQAITISTTMLGTLTQLATQPQGKRWARAGAILAYPLALLAVLAPVQRARAKLPLVTPSPSAPSPGAD